MQGLAKMAGEGSLRAFWRGNGANVVKNIPEMGLKLSAADYARQAFSADGRRPTLAQRLTIGGLAGAFAQARGLSQRFLVCLDPCVVQLLRRTFRVLAVRDEHCVRLSALFGSVPGSLLLSS